MERLRSIAFGLFFYGLTVPIVLLCPLVALFGQRVMVRYALMWLSLQRWSARHILNIRVTVIGTPPAEPALFAAKHESMFETLELARMLGAPSVVAKRELLQIPLWGRAAAVYGLIPVDRQASAKALRSILRAGEVTILFGEPVPTGLPRDEVEARVHAGINALNGTGATPSA